MTAQRSRIAALALMEKIGRYEMVEEAKRLGELRQMSSALRKDSDALQAKLVNETSDVPLEAQPYLSGFIRSVRSEAADCLDRAGKIDAEAEGLEERVLEAFRNLKTVQIALERTRHEALLAKRAAEDAKTDDLNSFAYGTHRRRG
ncbi:hypothetical protein [Histidinibacterium aquaticum]|uniref:Flagellar FliJ protein n=1 Tax=Histidinibacterium aquaticum TaxID=2613962 RepID=A0A5J5GNM7_9RHOB|nr:hypothetical protein [Histidinibacterium aquaticum]KAA9009986.1 hypothetical protein F3S47_01610 [Histidinibacterium aquaticum]